LILVFVGLAGVDLYNAYQDNRAVVGTIEYSIIQNIEQADPSIYVWTVQEEDGIVKVWVTWVPEFEHPDCVEEKKMVLMTFLNAILPPIYDAYPDASSYYVVTCEPVVMNSIETEGHILKGLMIWAFTPEGAEAIAAGITYDELEILGTNGSIDLISAGTLGGVNTVDVTERKSTHVRPW
jgi:hypothetical protein